MIKFGINIYDHLQYVKILTVLIKNYFNIKGMVNPKLKIHLKISKYCLCSRE